MLKTKICGIEFKNPILVASGTFGNGVEYSEHMDIEALGGICTTAVTYNPRSGNLGRRIHETPSGIMNSVGLQNPGIEEYLKTDDKFLDNLNTRVVVNLSGSTMEEYLKGAELLKKSCADMIELNISCPNVKEGGMAFGMEPEMAAKITRAIKDIVDVPLMVKLSPNAGDIVAVAKAVEEAGADCISMINTINALAIDIHTRRPVFENVTAGLSGPAIKPIALRMVYQVAKAVDIPIIGIGGISNYVDVVEFVMAGATAVQVGTANFVDPKCTEKIIKDLEEYMKREEIIDLSEIRGII